SVMYSSHGNVLRHLALSDQLAADISVSIRRIVRHIRAVLSNFDELLVRRTMQSVQSSVFVHLHHTAAVVLHLHTAATGSRSGRWCADCYNWIVHINRSRLVEFQRGFDCLARL